MNKVLLFMIFTVCSLSNIKSTEMPQKRSIRDYPLVTYIFTLTFNSKESRDYFNSNASIPKSLIKNFSKDDENSITWQTNVLTKNQIEAIFHPLCRQFGSLITSRAIIKKTEIIRTYIQESYAD